MAYTQFKTLAEIKQRLQVPHQKKSLLGHSASIQPSQILLTLIDNANQLSLKSEKSRSEFIVAPILLELKRNNDGLITFYSGDSLNVDAKLGLNGECDFVMTRETHSLEIQIPILQVVEAKKNDIDIGIPQCAAQMIAAQMLNTKEKTPNNFIYGCVTTGKDWQFMKLENNIIYIDNQTYYIDDLGKLLGIFQAIIDEYKDILD